MASTGASRALDRASLSTLLLSRSSISSSIRSLCDGWENSRLTVLSDTSRRLQARSRAPMLKRLPLCRLNVRTTPGHCLSSLAAGSDGRGRSPPLSTGAAWGGGEGAGRSYVLRVAGAGAVGAARLYSRVGSRTEAAAGGASGARQTSTVASSRGSLEPLSRRTSAVENALRALTIRSSGTSSTMEAMRLLVSSG